MEIDILQGFILPVFQLSFLLILICLAAALLSRKETTRLVCLQIVCLMGGLGLGLAAYAGIWSWVMLPGSVLLLVAFGVSIGRNGDRP